MIMPWEGGKAAPTLQRNLQRRKRSTESQLASITPRPRFASTPGPPQDTAAQPAHGAAQPGLCVIHPKTSALNPSYTSWSARRELGQHQGCSRCSLAGRSGPCPNSQVWEPCPQQRMCQCSGSTAPEHLDHRVPAWQDWKGPLWVTQPNPLPKQGHPQQAAEHHVQGGLEYLQRRRLHSLPGQPGPGLRQTHPFQGTLGWSCSLGTEEPSGAAVALLAGTLPAAGTGQDTRAQRNLPATTPAGSTVLMPGRPTSAGRPHILAAVTHPLLNHRPLRRSSRGSRSPNGPWTRASPPPCAKADAYPVAGPPRRKRSCQPKPWLFLGMAAQQDSVAGAGKGAPGHAGCCRSEPHSCTGGTILPVWGFHPSSGAQGAAPGAFNPGSTPVPPFSQHQLGYFTVIRIWGQAWTRHQASGSKQQLRGGELPRTSQGSSRGEQPVLFLGVNIKEKTSKPPLAFP